MHSTVNPLTQAGALAVRIRVLLGVFVLAHLFLNVAHLRSIEFFGKDEAYTVLVNARVILGMMHGNLGNLVAPMGAGHPPVRYLVQIPFQIALGVNEISAYLPHIIASLGIFLLMIRIGRQFLRPSGLVILALLYTTSGAYAINRSPNGHGIFILLELASFYLIESFQDNGDPRARTAAWSIAAVATLTYLEAILFTPYLAIRSIRERPTGSVLAWASSGRGRAELKSLGRAAISFALPLLGWAIVFILLPTLIVGRPADIVLHLLEREGTVRFVRNNFPLLVKNYVYTLGPPSTVLIATGLVLAAIARVPRLLRRCAAFFALHLFAWLFLFDLECGHTLYAYPIFLLGGAYGLQQAYLLLAKRTYKAVFAGSLACVAVLSAVYSFSVYNDPTPQKELHGTSYFQDYLPCGVNYAHKVGLKSAAYLIRSNSESDDLFVGDTGDGMQLYLLGRKNAAVDLDDVMSQLRSTPDVDLYSLYSVRYIGLRTSSACFPERAQLLSRFSPPAFEILGNGGETSYVVWDILHSGNTLVRVDQVDQYDHQFDAQYSAVTDRFSAWIGYWPQRIPKTDRPNQEP